MIDEWCVAHMCTIMSIWSRRKMTAIHYLYPTLPSSQVSRIVAGCRAIRTNKNEYMNMNIWVRVLVLHFAKFFLDWTCGASLGWCGDPNVSGLLGFGHWKQSLAFRGATVKFVQCFFGAFPWEEWTKTIVTVTNHQFYRAGNILSIVLYHENVEHLRHVIYNIHIHIVVYL